MVLSGQGASPIGGKAVAFPYTNKGSTPAVTMVNTDGSSQLLHFAAMDNYSPQAALSISGYTTRYDGKLKGGEQLEAFTKNDTTSDGATSGWGTFGGTSAQNWMTATIEILAP